MGLTLAFLAGAIVASIPLILLLVSASRRIDQLKVEVAHDGGMIRAYQDHFHQESRANEDAVD